MSEPSAHPPFEPRNEWEREAIDAGCPPHLREGDSVIIDRTGETATITGIYLRTVDRALWLYAINGDENRWYDWWQFRDDRGPDWL